jgi:hypothetical protein
VRRIYLVLQAVLPLQQKLAGERVRVFGPVKRASERERIKIKPYAGRILVDLVDSGQQRPEDLAPRLVVVTIQKCFEKRLTVYTHSHTLIAYYIPPWGSGHFTSLRPRVSNTISKALS